MPCGPRGLAAPAQGRGEGDCLGQGARHAAAESFTAAYGRYCWPTEGLDGVRLAPFQVLATEGRSLAEDAGTPVTAAHE